jgi:flagellar motor switch protein FliG
MEDIHTAKAIKIEPENDDDAGKEQQQQEPPRKLTKSRGGQMMEYNFLESVKSVEELDKLRFKVNLKNKTKKLRKMRFSLTELLHYEWPQTIAYFQIPYPAMRKEKIKVRPAGKTMRF